MVADPNPGEILASSLLIMTKKFSLFISGMLSLMIEMATHTESPITEPVGNTNTSSLSDV